MSLLRASPELTHGGDGEMACSLRDAYYTAEALGMIDRRPAFAARLCTMAERVRAVLVRSTRTWT